MNKSDFHLLETMRIEPNGVVYLLERHLDRLQAAARYFDFKCELSLLLKMIDEAVAESPKPAALRLLLARNGSCVIESLQLPSGKTPLRLQLSRQRVDSRNPFVLHKTTKREVYDSARKECFPGSEPLLVNERDEVTETSIFNIAVRRGTQWITPSLFCGLLPGTLRAELLAAGEIVEGVIRSDALVPGEVVRCFNSVRGTLDLPLILPAAGPKRA